MDQMPINVLLTVILLSSLQPLHQQKTTDLVIHQTATDLDKDLSEICTLLSTLKLEKSNKIAIRRTHDETSPEKAKKPISGKYCKYNCGKIYMPGHKCYKKHKPSHTKNEPSTSKNYVSRAAYRSVVVNDEDGSLDNKDDVLPCKQTIVHTVTDQKVKVPMYIENKPISALVDGGANFSAISLQFCKQNNIEIKSLDVEGFIQLAQSEHKVKRIGTTPMLAIRYNGKHCTSQFEVMDLAQGHVASIGTDLMPVLGIGYYGLATCWDPPQQDDQEDPFKDVLVPNEDPAGTPEEHALFMSKVQGSLFENAAIPKNSFCTVPESVIYLPTPKGVFCHRKQYDIPYDLRQIVQETVDQWLADGTIVPVPANIDNK